MRSLFCSINGLCLLFLLGISGWSRGQIPVEFFGGNERATVDIMFFRNLYDRQNVKTRWLFFNRNRASVDYRMTRTTYLPQFGFTEAFSYNHERLRGFAPVWVGQILSAAVMSKAGVQFAHLRKDVTIFSWLVTETGSVPDIDFFFLFRYTPKLTERIALFTQAESVNVFPTSGRGYFSFTQRIRLGVRRGSFQFGAAGDFNQSGHHAFAHFRNLGIFIRNEF